MTDESDTEVWHLRGPLEQARGVIGRDAAPGDRFVFHFDAVKPRTIHMVGVRRPLRVQWWAGDELAQEKRLRPWIGLGRAAADRVVEIVPERSDD